jgi:hypothetical protein
VNRVLRMTPEEGDIGAFQELARANTAHLAGGEVESVVQCLGHLQTHSLHLRCPHLLLRVLRGEFVVALLTLSGDLTESAVVGNLGKTDWVVKHATTELSLVFDVLVADHTVIEALVFAKLTALVTAASQNRPRDEQNRSRDNEQGMLADVNQQNHEQEGTVALDLGDFCDEVNGLAALKDLLGMPNNVERVAEDSRLHNPLDKGRHGKALIRAELLKAAETEDTIDDVVEANSESLAGKFTLKADVGEEVVVGQVHNRQKQADRDKDEDLQNGSALVLELANLLHESNARDEHKDGHCK